MNPEARAEDKNKKLTSRAGIGAVNDPEAREQRTKMRH
jgi:hypothetical protein